MFTDFSYVRVFAFSFGNLRNPDINQLLKCKIPGSKYSLICSHDCISKENTYIPPYRTSCCGNISYNSKCKVCGIDMCACCQSYAGDSIRFGAENFKCNRCTGVINMKNKSPSFHESKLKRIKSKKQMSKIDKSQFKSSTNKRTKQNEGKNIENNFLNMPTILEAFNMTEDEVIRLLTRGIDIKEEYWTYKASNRWSQFINTKIKGNLKKKDKKGKTTKPPNRTLKTIREDYQDELVSFIENLSDYYVSSLNDLRDEYEDLKEDGCYYSD
jgi:hypothetical protein